MNLGRYITPSRLDEYLKFKSGYIHQFGDDWPEYTPDAFVKKLLGMEPATIAMTIGIKIHKAIELAPYGCMPKEFSLDDEWRVICNKEIEIPTPECREMWISRKFNSLTLRGRVDSIDANNIHDLKTTSSFDLDRYMQSMQWKSYLWMSGYNNFIYDVVIIKSYIDDKRVEILDYQKVPLTRYANLDQEVEEVILDYYACLQRLEPLIIKTAKENNIILKR